MPSSSARRSTRNFTPSGSALNCRSSVTRGGVNAARSARSAARRWSGSSAREHLGAPFDDRVVIGVELLGQQPQKALATGRVQRQIGAAEFGRAGPRRDFAAAAVETVQHALAQP